MEGKEMKGENCLAVFNLGHLDYSIGGMLSDTGVQGPPLRLVSRHNLPALGRKNVPEDKRRGSGMSF